MSESIESNEDSGVTSESGSLSRRRVIGLGAAVAGGVWVAPAILSFDAASAEPSGGGPTTSTTAPPVSTTTTTAEPPTTTTTAAPRTITASVTGTLYGVWNPSPVTVAVGEPIDLVFTRTAPGAFDIFYMTQDGTATAGVDYTGVPPYGHVVMASNENSKTISIQTTATGAGANTAFTVIVTEP